MLKDKFVSRFVCLFVCWTVWVPHTGNDPETIETKNDFSMLFQQQQHFLSFIRGAQIAR